MATLPRGHKLLRQSKEARTMARLAVNSGDDGTNDLIVSDVIRRNDL
jgi:hypothetical protein